MAEKNLITKSKLFGARSGDPWDDITSAVACSSEIVGVRTIAISHSDHSIDSIQVTYALADGTTYKAPAHGKSSLETGPDYGKSGASTSFIRLNEDEIIYRVKVDQCDKTRLNGVTFITRKTDGKDYTYGPYGKKADLELVLQGFLVRFYGYADNDGLSGIGAYHIPIEISEEYGPMRRSQQLQHGGSGAGGWKQTLEESGPYGGSRGSEFSDVNNPPIIGIRQLTISYGAVIDRITVEYNLLGGNTRTFEHGGTGGSGVGRPPGNDIMLISGRTAEVVTQLNFEYLTGSNTAAGPYGSAIGIPFQMPENADLNTRIVSFFGRSGRLVNALGVFYTQTPTPPRV